MDAAPNADGDDGDDGAAGDRVDGRTSDHAGAHGEVVATLDLPADAEAASIARRFVADNSDSLPSALVADAQLLVSEIVSNAVRHGRPDVTLRVRLHPPGIGIEVSDAGPELPVLSQHRPGPTQPSGRGLMIVDAVASAWGVDPAASAPGKTVWFDLDPE